MLKNDPVWSTEGKEPEDCYRTEPGGMSDGEILEAKRDKANTNQKSSGGLEANVYEVLKLLTAFPF